MKITRYTFLIILCFFLINLLTYFLIGKQSLRERNVSEMMKTEVENWDELELTFVLRSNQDLNSELKINNVTYPVTSFEAFKEEGFIDSVDAKIRFWLNENEADSLFKTNLDSLHLIYSEKGWQRDQYFEITLFRNPYFIEYIASLSQENFSTDQKLGGWCEYHKSEDRTGSIRCMILWKEFILLSEDIKSSRIFFTEQNIAVNTYRSEYDFSREEKLIWLFYRWVQIDWIDGNGLGGDTPSWER